MLSNKRDIACRQAGTPEPRIRAEPRDLRFEFPFSGAYLDSLVSRAGERWATPETRVETRVRTPGEILRLLAAGPEMTLAEVAEAIGKFLRAVERASAKLAKEGRLRYVGPRKGGHWEVLEDGDE